MIGSFENIIFIFIVFILTGAPSIRTTPALPIQTKSEGMGLISNVVEKSVALLRPSELIRDNAKPDRSHFCPWHVNFLQAADVEIDIVDRLVVSLQIHPLLEKEKGKHNPAIEMFRYRTILAVQFRWPSHQKSGLWGVRTFHGICCSRGCRAPSHVEW